MLARCTRTLVALALLTLLGGTRAAHAQFMDMSWAVQSQMMNQAYADYMAQYAAMQWLQDVAAYRQATGYTGPIYAPFNAATISNSVNAANQAFDGYCQSWYANSQATCNAVENYSNQAILNQAPYYNPYTGQQYMVPNYYNSYYVNPAGVVTGTDGGYPAYPYTDWTQLEPGW
ncbi:MAG TPA: hypothetical protein VNO81_05865 [Candidatus Nitrosotenuis sp.]|jgi:hypothetical protein|nr:hypothetical protein [Candidatus Nitrosotenuis sp.]